MILSRKTPQSLLRFLSVALPVTLLWACNGTPKPLTEFQSLCGHSYKGEVVSTDPQDADWRGEVLTIGPVTCTDTERVAIPLAVGTDQSRIWIFSESGEQIEFRHQHTLKDGSPDPVSQYGGFASVKERLESGGIRLEFPADEQTRRIFEENDLEVSMTNVWAVELTPGDQFIYHLTRSNRDFKAVFDLSQPQ